MQDVQTADVIVDSPEMLALANEWVDRIIKEQKLKEKWSEAIDVERQRLEKLKSWRLLIFISSL